jgi:hypothetical protein
MIWELSQDHWNGSSQYDPWSLLPVIKSVFRAPAPITSLTTSPSDNAIATAGANQAISVTITANVSSAGVLQVSLISDTNSPPRDWFYVSSPGTVTHTFTLNTTDTVLGTEFYELYTQFRAGVSSGPFSNVLSTDTLKLAPFHLNWKDFTPPSFVNGSMDMNTRKITLTMSETLASSPVGSASITPAGGSAINIGAGVVSGNTVTFTLPSNLADNNYTLNLPAGVVRDPSANLSGAWSWGFFMLSADANHDRAVDSLDFAALASNFNAAASMSFTSGDFNYDGRINALDFNLLAAKYGTTLPSEPLASEIMALSARPAGSLFNSSRITHDKDDAESMLDDITLQACAVALPAT